MSLTPLRQLLTDQHRTIDLGVSSMADGSGQPAAIAESLTLLRRHIYIEETVLFPSMETSGLSTLSSVMKREHGDLWPLLGNLTRSRGMKTAIEARQATARWLRRLLQTHDLKEEQVVYHMADQLMDTAAGETLVHQLEVASVPDGWICAAASA